MTSSDIFSWVTSYFRHIFTLEKLWNMKYVWTNPNREEKLRVCTVQCTLYSVQNIHSKSVTPIPCYLLHAASLVRFGHCSLPSIYSRAMRPHEVRLHKGPRGWGLNGFIFRFNETVNGILYTKKIITVPEGTLLPYTVSCMKGTFVFIIGNNLSVSLNGNR